MKPIHTHHNTEAATGHPTRFSEQNRKRNSVMNLKNLKLLGFGALVSIAGFAHSQSTDSGLNDSLLQDLDQRVRVLDRLREIDDENAKAAAAKAPKISAGEGGFGISSADGAYSIKLRGFVQGQGVSFLSNATPVTKTTVTPNTTANGPSVSAYSIKRLQADIGGSLGKQFDYRYHINYSAGTADLLDVNLDWKILPEFNVRLGKFKPPTGLERLLTPARAPFIEGSFVTALQPNRDIGFQFFGSVSEGLVDYQAGLFNGARDGQNNTGDNNIDKDVYARVFAQPFLKSDLDFLSGFGVGVSGSVGHHGQYNVAEVKANVTTSTSATNNTPAAGGAPLTAVTTVASVSNGISTYSTGRQTVFSYASQDTSEGRVARISPQAYYYYGPFGLIAEYTSTKQNIRRATFNKDLTNTAWALTASYFITGEKNDYKKIKVKKNNTFPTLDGIGGIELLGRIHALNIDDHAFDSLTTNRTVRYADPSKQVTEALGYGAAIKWYLNSNVVLFAGYEYTQFTGGAGTTAAAAVNPVVKDREAEKVLSGSFNVSF
jgi:phosphate-selective porin OprO/OprP